MLVLSRKIGERIRIGDDVVLTVVRIHGDKVRLGIDAPTEVAIHREEVYRRLRSPASGPGPGPEPEPGPEATERGGTGPEGADSSLSGGRAAR
ncbi:carbon storage regulator CsrA [Tautonia sociabilis]|uniref:Translational regulator CsrA n=1 Tax=Tautonia sociabilis TaxID=2080755 RepID=A0A432MJC2_9BACT|nr:carbon storage regulator CsrA [Tautonia sociabilis]RUL87471.1 carbon storage regulator [Tautonia sociabilis]